MAPRTQLSLVEKDFVLRLRVARLATSNEQGSPTLVPVCYAFDGTHFFTPLDEKPKRVPGTQLRRVHNIEARHEASLLIDQYSDDWSQLGYVQVYGHAELIYPDHPLHTPAMKLLRERYSQYRDMALEQAPFIMLTPRRIRSWGPALQP
ncbi:TIGR03668 family PPOX class F420-dependent oxidoreductase [Dictyobacter aurantiacus]|uniref:PPOX class F420-dependent oxidoreductase n=1 Tax=Dictyobacter aurantiacus TaxID=1936993 RepID=A0A401ZAI7_9CHLR|nr:TIGR03668 family PPOX class F420-dependent oxidoreductase [Dictyobacter aurantiacus]GCE03880.1 PPOX class F420-dependent oxidoreductase [Dictyobacter aurantiacus]